MHISVVLIIAAVVAGTSACCYTLQSNPRSDKVPIYTWYLDTMSQQAVRPTDCVGNLRPVDQTNPPTLSACELTRIEYRPMALPEIGWRDANITDAQQVVFTQPCIGFGPYRAGERPSSLLLHQLSGSWLRLHLVCDDSVFASCVHFGLQLRQAAQSKLVVEEVVDPYLDTCVRTASGTPSRTPTPSHTPSATSTPSATPLPAYGSVFRIELTMEGGIFTALQVALDYTKLKASAGSEGALWCSAPVLDEQRTHLITTLFPDSSPERSIIEWAHAAVSEQSSVQVTVLWSTGGWCRVTLDYQGVLTFNGCRLFVENEIYETTSWLSVQQLDSRAGPVCGTVVTASDANPTPSPKPVDCSGTLGWRIDTLHDLVTMRSATEYAEARLALEKCSDGSERPRLDAVSSLLNTGTGEEQRCAIDPGSQNTRAYCGDRLLLEIAGTTCASIEVPDMTDVERCIADKNAILLV